MGVWSAIVGKNTKTTCTSERKVNWIWTFQNRILPLNAEPTTTSNSNITHLTIKQTQKENSGTYQCNAFDDDNNLFITELRDLKVIAGESNTVCILDSLIVYSKLS